MYECFFMHAMQFTQTCIQDCFCVMDLGCNRLTGTLIKGVECYGDQ